MTIDKILYALKNLNVIITSRTLLNYENQVLIPKPIRQSLGYGRGKLTEYPDYTVCEAYAAYQLLNGEVKTSPSNLKDVRQHALALLEEKKIKYVYDVNLEALTILWVYHWKYARTNKRHYVRYHQDVNGYVGLTSHPYYDINI